MICCMITVIMCVFNSNMDTVVRVRLSKMYIATILILFVDIVLKAEAARILGIFPTPSISHQVAFRPIVHELVRRGHDVTVLTPDPAFPKGKTPSNLTEIDVHDLSYGEFVEELENEQGSKLGFISLIQLIIKKTTIMFEKQIQVPEFKKLFDQKFDLLLVEAHVRPALGLSHVFKIPVIQISSLGGGSAMYSAFGAPSHPLLYPSPIAQRLYNLTLLEKAAELFKIYFVEFMISQVDEFDYEMMRRHFGDDVPNYEVLQNNVEMLFLNEHSIWSNNHPVPPNIIYVGGIHQPLEPKLSQELKTFLDSSKNGVIYVSFGTNVKPSALPRERILVMTKVLSQLPYDVLWKWDKDELPGKSNNIKVYKWFPQPSLLKHPKIKLFITQGGLQSTDEAINAAVPLIGIPMLGDQWYNVEKYTHHKIGLQLDINDLTEDNFKNAIERVIGDKSFSENIARLRSLMREQPIKPLELAVWWIEHVLKYGGAHLRSPAAGLSFTEYYEVPLLLTIAFILATVTTIIVASIVFLVRIIKKYFVKSPEKKKKQKSK